MSLLIGIEKYKVERFNLRGTVNDVRNMRRLLIETFGFRPEQIVTLTDAEATRDNILKAFEQWLIAGSASGRSGCILYEQPRLSGARAGEGLGARRYG